MEEENNAVHTPANPYCDDPNHWCHSDADYHEQILQPAEPTEEEIALACAFFGITPLEEEDDE
jgi:hypothetical protein